MGQSGFGEDICSNVRIGILVVFFLGKQKCVQHRSEDSRGFAEITVKFISIALLYVFLWFRFESCWFFFIVLCYHSVLSKPAFPALDLLREHEGKMKWSNIFCLSSSCCQLSLSGTISHFMTHYRTWVSFAPLSVCLAEFLNVFLWLPYILRLESVLFINSVTFWAFKAFLPSPPFYQSVFVRALQGWKWALSLLTQLVGLQCERDSDCTQVWWNAITEQPQIPQENCNNEGDQGISFISAELCTVGVHGTIPKLILLTWTFRTVDFITFILVASSSVPDQDDHCHGCSVQLLVKSRRLHSRWLEMEMELSAFLALPCKLKVQ